MGITPALPPHFAYLISRGLAGRTSGHDPGAGRTDSLGDDQSTNTAAHSMALATAIKCIVFPPKSAMSVSLKSSSAGHIASCTGTALSKHFSMGTTNRRNCPMTI
jgi:hypothetical protein